MEVIVYSAKSCSYCERQKEFLLAKGIYFKEVDIRESEQNFNEFKSLGGTGTPFTVKRVDGQVVSKILGFDKEKLLEELLL
ncbi:glutaredoxin [Bacillus manliponensis]|uniref:Glutaredoxin n=1 Tax=Bacillus manliponensis TaxID=574376 RepID=A0A073JXZ6_9BACI|nr:glutaredoxin family protein [Bacillus manliponensis]KEK19160.1 glutaredoxin [Bacillus manliponensis]